MHSEFEAVIGLEVHCQLATNSKLFCGCQARTSPGQSVADVEVNLNTCPICAGHPGTLPVLNEKAVEFAVKAGLATHCEIRLKNVFARKNYFYPDLPKGYQISQYEKPICEMGWLMIETPQGEKKINIQRIHIEEDAGKSIHLSSYSLVNLNRAGVPLIEIVTAPDISTPEEAGAYLRNLYLLVTHLGICDGNLQEGNFRCDANVSIRPKGSTQLGTRAEIKNLNSFRFVEKAIQYEILRQIEVVRSGRQVVQETRSYDSDQNKTFSLRSKEEAQDYRYFPDPDLIPVQIHFDWVEKIKKEMPELPEQKKKRIIQDFGLSSHDAGILTESLFLYDFFEQTVNFLLNQGLDKKTAAKLVVNWTHGEILRLQNEYGTDLKNSFLQPSHLAELIQLIMDQVISIAGAKQVIEKVWNTGNSVKAIIEQEGLKQVSDIATLENLVQKIVAAHPRQVAEYRSGKEKLLGFFIGQVMKETGGKANPNLLGEIVKKYLSAHSNS